MSEELLSVDEAIRHLSTLILRDETLDTTLTRIVHVASRAMPGTVGVSITLQDRGRPFTAAATSPRVQAIDEQEYAVDEGPCITAMATGEIQRLPDVDIETRWPKFTEVCRREGLGSTFGVPLRVGNETHGAMNVYAAEPHAFNEEHEQAAQLLADQAGVALANSRTYDECTTKIRQLEQALETRLVIERAKGVIMVREGCDADAAFDVLRVASQTSNRKLRDVAQAVVDSVSAGPPPP